MTTFLAFFLSPSLFFSALFLHSFLPLLFYNAKRSIVSASTSVCLSVGRSVGRSVGLRHVNSANIRLALEILLALRGAGYLRSFFSPWKFIIPNSYGNMLILRARCYAGRRAIFFENCRCCKARNRDSIFTLKGTPMPSPRLFLFLLLPPSSSLNPFSFFLAVLSQPGYTLLPSICTFSTFNRVYPASSLLLHTLHITFSLLSPFYTLY